MNVNQENQKYIYNNDILKNIEKHTPKSTRKFELALIAIMLITPTINPIIVSVHTSADVYTLIVYFETIITAVVSEEYYSRLVSIPTREKLVKIYPDLVQGYTCLVTVSGIYIFFFSKLKVLMIAKSTYRFSVVLCFVLIFLFLFLNVIKRWKQESERNIITEMNLELRYLTGVDMVTYNSDNIIEKLHINESKRYNMVYPIVTSSIPRKYL